MNSPANTITKDTSSVLTVISLGANLHSRIGAPEDTLRSALAAIECLGSKSSSMRVSPFLETEPVGCPPGSAKFTNAVAIVQPRSDFDPISFLQALHDIEDRHGRERDGLPNQSRTLDLDLICWGSLILKEQGLILPHPRAHERLFVLQPLAELEPDFVLPGQAVSVSELLLQIDSDSG